MSDKEKKDEDKRSSIADVDEVPVSDVDKMSLPPTKDQTHRMLKGRHIQLIGMGGTIGTALFVQIGAALTKGGPGSLFLAFVIWCSFILAVNNCLSEMVTWMPISSPFVRFADHFVDEAFGFAAGYNFFIFEAALIPFEVTAFNVVLHFWTDAIPTAAVIAIVLFLYAVLNVFAVKWYGESEFWLALFKVLLAVGVIAFVFVTMLGGNPIHDRYGFRFWNPDRVPGTPFAEYIYDGAHGRFVGFLACLIQASFTIAGPDYVSMTGGEAEFPRKTLPRAFKSVTTRLVFFFILGTLAVGTVVSYQDPNLFNAISNAHPGAAASPYVIAMQRLQIPVLPHIVNAGVLSAVFSAGNSYVFCSSRVLLGLALEGKAPRFLTRCTKSGVPIYCVAVSIGIAFLSFLQVSNNAAVVLQWFVNLVTASQLLNFAIISFAYLRFYKAMQVLGIPRSVLPHRSYWQPFSAYYSLVGNFVMAFVGGYMVFLPGHWDIPTFFFSYTMLAVVPILFVGWKLVHKTKWHAYEDIEFFELERRKVDRYEADFVPEKPGNYLVRLMDFLFG